MYTDLAATHITSNNCDNELNTHMFIERIIMTVIQHIPKRVHMYRKQPNILDQHDDQGPLPLAPGPLWLIGKAQGPLGLLGWGQAHFVTHRARACPLGWGPGPK